MKKKDKLVSVVVQAYNSADTIVRTLESVKAQDYEKIELIVTDDKSTDQTIEEVAAWSLKKSGALLPDAACHSQSKYRNSREQQSGAAACDRSLCRVSGSR